MPLYDCMLLLKPHVKKEALMDLVARVGKHVYRRNGVLADIKSFGIVQLGYGIKKLDGRYYQVIFFFTTLAAF
jgi:small subunit ribosomal protein S6